MAFKHLAGATTSLRLLDELQALGFDDEAFSALHHFSVKPGRNGDTIERHRRHLIALGSGNVRAANERVQRRLRLVLDTKRQVPSRSFLDLAKFAVDRIPFALSDYEPGDGKYGEDTDD